MIQPILGKRLKNTISEYIYPIEGLENNNFLALAVKVGSADEKEEVAGIAHFLEHVQMNFFNKKECDYLCSAYTDFYSTTFYFDVKSESINKVIELIHGIIIGRFLKDFDIEKIRMDILKEYESYMQKNLQANFRFILEDTEYEHHIPIGTHKRVSGFSKKDIRKFYEEFYLLGNMSIIWIGSPTDIEKIGMEWIENLNGIYGGTKQKILDYKFPSGKIVSLKEKEINSMDIYFFRKRDQHINTINEIIITMLEKVLNKYVGEAKVEKIYLSCMEEFIHIRFYESRRLKEMQEVLKKITLEELEDLCMNISNREPVGCNCNFLRECCINSFIFNVEFGKENINIENELNTLLNILKMTPVIIFK